MPQPDVAKCPKCAAPLRSGLLGGHCPACVMRVALCEGEGDVGEGFASVGEYDFLEKNAYGGMGVVYRARQRSLNRVVALKMVIGGQFAGAEKLRRFRAEAESAARLDHPHIVPVYEVGEYDGLPFYSMRFIEGKSLAAKLAASPGGCLPPREAAELIVKVARAVHYAHQRGLLHRDLKPSNILLDEDGEPHVTDFGIAKDLEQGSGTLSGQVLGTPEYMPPEQATGKVHEQTTAVDVFSLGAILYRALTGRPPFAGESAASSLALAMQGYVPRPASLGVRLDTDIETICMRCLERDPMQRFGSADALADDLSRWLEGKPILARRTPFPRRVWKWALRNPAIAALSVLFMTTRAVIYVKSKADANGRLRDSLLAQAHAMVRSNEHGQRQTALDALRAAAKLAPGADVREEFISALVLQDFAERAKLPWSGGVAPALSADFHTIAEISEGKLIVRRTDGTVLSEVASLPEAIDGIGPFSPTAGLLVVNTPAHTRIWDVSAGAWREFAPGTTALDRGTEEFFSADGKKLVRGVMDKALVEVFTLDGSAPVRNWTAPWKRSKVAGFNPDGTLIAVRQYGGPELVLYETANGAVRHTLRLPDAARTRAAAWRADGQVLAVGTENFKIYLWRPGENQMPPQLLGHSGNLLAVAWSPDGSRIVSSAMDGTTRVWDTATGAMLAKWPQLGRFVACSSDGAEFASADDEARVTVIRRLRDPDFCRVLHVPHPDLDERGTAGSWCAEFSPDGRLIIAGDTLGVFFFNAQTGAPAGHQPANYCWSVSFPDATGFYAGTRAGVYRWPLPGAGGSGEQIYSGDTNMNAAAAGMLAIAAQKELLIFKGGKVESKLDAPDFLDRLALHPRAESVAASMRDRPGLFVWDLRSLATPPRFISTSGPEAAPRWTRDGRLLIVGDTAGIRAFEAGSLAEKWRIQRPRSGRSVSLVSIAQSAELAATVLEDGVVTLFEPMTGKVIVRLVHPHPREIQHVSIAPDGSKVAAMTLGHVIQVWDIAAIRRELATEGLDWR